MHQHRTTPYAASDHLSLDVCWLYLTATTPLHSTRVVSSSALHSLNHTALIPSGHAAIGRWSAGSGCCCLAAAVAAAAAVCGWRHERRRRGLHRSWSQLVGTAAQHSIRCTLGTTHSLTHSLTPTHLSCYVLLRTDTSGAGIECHAPGLLWDAGSSIGGGVWWCGESEKTSDLSAHGINCYYSADFSEGGMSWADAGMVLSQAAVSVPGHRGPFTLERPKLLFHVESGMYVLWFHIDDESYSVRRVGVAVSADIRRGFSFVRSFQPDGLPSLDMSVFADYRDGAVVGAYFIRSVDNSYVGISRIANDYMDTTGLISIIPEAREGHAVFYHAQWGRYLMLTSHLTGWAPNAMEAFISSTDQLEGTEWLSIGNPTGSSDSFDSQPALVWPYTSKTTNQSYFIYMGDRWDAPFLLNASYIWLPIVVHDNRTLSIPWRSQWQLNDPFHPARPPAAAARSE